MASKASKRSAKKNPLPAADAPVPTRRLLRKNAGLRDAGREPRNEELLEPRRRESRDITAAELDRARLEALNRRLEQTVAERTAALHESLARLQAQEERLRLALEAGGLGVWTVDIANGTGTNDARHAGFFARGWPESGVPMREWVEAVHPDDRARMVAVMERAMSGAEPRIAAEYRIVWPDGSVHWLMVRGQVFYDARGAPVRIVGVEQSIDERKTLESEVLHISDTEQRRIGQELHDDIQQRLTGLGLIAENLCEQAQRSPGQESRLAQGIADTARRVNRLSHGLVPLDLNGEGLSVALNRLAQETDAAGAPHCSFKTEAGLEIRDGFVASHLYRIAQEALTNALRHSGASRIAISLSRTQERMVLTVADNGCGIGERAADRIGSGRGLRIMAYRASLVGAVLKVARARSGSAAKGTVVSCTLTPVAGGEGQPGH